jgi:hypothetical protein
LVASAFTANTSHSHTFPDCDTGQSTVTLPPHALEEGGAVYKKYVSRASEDINAYPMQSLDAQT